jgi:hypothetical protein
MASQRILTLKRGGLSNASKETAGGNCRRLVQGHGSVSHEGLEGIKRGDLTGLRRKPLVESSDRRMHEYQPIAGKRLGSVHPLVGPSVDDERNLGFIQTDLANRLQ